MTESAVSLSGPNGGLLAILHRSEDTDSTAPCVIMLSSGQVPSFAPQRLYVKAARAWAQRGMQVLRVDLSGVGDSEAENPEIHVDNHLPQDVAVAVAYARDVLGARRIVLLGNCAGARVAIKYAASDPLVDAVVCWNVPIFGDGPVAYKGSMSDSYARENLRRLLHDFVQLRFLSPAWWAWVRRNAKVFTGAIIRSISYMLFERYLSRNRLASKKRQFIDALSNYLDRNREILFIYGSVDRVALRELLQRFPSIKRDLHETQAVHVIPDGSHTLATIAAEQEAISVSGDWILGRAGVQAPTCPVETLREVKTA